MVCKVDIHMKKRNGRMKAAEVKMDDLNDQFSELKGELKTIKMLLAAAIPAIYLGLLKALIG